MSKLWPGQSRTDGRTHERKHIHRTKIATTMSRSPQAGSTTKRGHPKRILIVAVLKLDQLGFSVRQRVSKMQMEWKCRS